MFRRAALPLAVVLCAACDKPIDGKVVFTGPLPKAAPPAGAPTCTRGDWC